MKRGEPSFTVALVMSIVPLAVIGAFAGVQVRDDPDAVVATTLFIVAIIDVLGLVRYVAYGAEHRERDRLHGLYEVRVREGGLAQADLDEAEQELFQLDKRDIGFDGAWMLLPQLAVSGFALAMAVAALAGG